MFAGGDVSDGHEPDHERVSDRKMARLDIGKNAQDRVFAGAGVDMDAVASEPGQKLRFGLHAPKRAAQAAGGNSFSPGPRSGQRSGRASGDFSWREGGRAAWWVGAVCRAYLDARAHDAGLARGLSAVVCGAVRDHRARRPDLGADETSQMDAVAADFRRGGGRVGVGGVAVFSLTTEFFELCLGVLNTGPQPWHP